MDSYLAFQQTKEKARVAMYLHQELLLCRSNNKLYLRCRTDSQRYQCLQCTDSSSALRLRFLQAYNNVQ